jgi:PAS domain S-box-containing protein
MTGECQSDFRVVILAPIGRDSALIAKLLRENEVESHPVTGVPELIQCIQECCGAAIVAEEAFSADAVRELAGAMRGQPSWSDFPLLVLTGGGGSTVRSRRAAEARAPLGNQTLLERPIRPVTLVSAVQAALRSRRHQYEVRAHLEKQRAQGEALLAAMNAAERDRSQLEAVFQAMSDGVIVFDMGGNAVIVNEAQARICGYESAEEMKRDYEYFSSVWELCHPDGTPLSVDEWPLTRVLGGESVIDWELRCRRRDTLSESYFSFTGQPIRDRSGRQVLALIMTRDVTERKHVQETLLRSEKLASVGRMAATLAHEINNPLTAVLNTVYLARVDKDLPDAARDYLEMADAELRRISHISRQALGFYRESTAPTLVSVEELLDSVVDLLHTKINSCNATVVTEIEENLQVMGVSGELRQVFSNLLANSLDAIGEHGQVRVKASTRGDGNGDRAAWVTIADNGKGIAPSTLARIFEPFFTTKGKLGTGLGLWISKEIIHKHGGRIQVRSSTSPRRRGTVFSVILPMVVSADVPEEHPIAA